MNDGDFIRINFEMYVGEDKKLVSTNSEQLAKDNGIYDENTKYKETVLIVGSDVLFKEVNESLKQAETGKEYEVSIKAEDAYGLRDPKNIKVHTVREFQRQKIDPVPGQEVSIGGRRGKVISVTPGRVLVDYNHQWAGKPVLYKYTVLGVVDQVPDKVRALIDYNYNVDSGEFNVEENGDVISISVPEKTKFDVAWLEAKFRLVSDIRKYIPGKDIEIRESYKREETPKPEEKPAEPTEAASEEKNQEEAKVEQKNTE
jgi:FKBP-type peptidyl-prolyl cis-trans isomerase 2